MKPRLTSSSLLWDKETATAVDRLSAERHGVNPLDLMESAGRAVARERFLDA